MTEFMCCSNASSFAEASCSGTVHRPIRENSMHCKSRFLLQSPGRTEKRKNSDIASGHVSHWNWKYFFCVCVLHAIRGQLDHRISMEGKIFFISYLFPGFISLITCGRNTLSVFPHFPLQVFSYVHIHTLIRSLN